MIGDDSIGVCLMLLLSTTALAAPVVYPDAVPPDFVSGAATAGASSVDPVALSSLVVPSGVAPGEARGCSEPAANLSSGDAEAAIAYMKWDEAATLLDALLAAEACLASPADGATGSRTHYLRALVAVHDEDKPLAWTEFQVAATLDPELVWDESFPPVGRPVFDAALAELDAAEPLELVVVAEQAWVDGREVEAGVHALRPGPHLLQLGDAAGAITTYKTTLNPGVDYVLVQQEAVTDELLDDLSSKQSRVLLGAVLRAAGGHEVWYAMDAQEAVWRYDALGDEWTRGTGGVAGDWTGPTSRALLVGGVGAVVVGGTLMAVGGSRGRAAYREMEQATHRPEYDVALEGYNGAQRPYTTGLVLLGAGAAVGLGGYALGRATGSGTQIGLAPLPGGAGLVVTVDR
jgi:hypothetical protein